MEVRVQAGQLGDADADTIAVNLFQGVTSPGGATGAIDRATDGAISRLIAAGDFTGKLNQTAVLYPPPGEPGELGVRATRIVVVGLGKQGEFTLDRIRQVSATVARKARDLGARRLATIVHGAGAGSISSEVAARAVVEGTLLGLYRYDALKSRRDDGDSRRGPDELLVVELDSTKVPAIEAGARRGRILAESTTFARDLVNQPGNVLYPTTLAAAAEEMAGAVGLRFEALGLEQIAALEMGALLGVAQGSEQPPRFIILEHAPPGSADQPPIVICGKGITFDTGGISIKPSEGMGEMKTDMGGGAAAIGALRALALLETPRRAIALVPAVENMPSGRAIRPGDVLRAMDGQTIEVISTDAEGRLVLADALAYAHRFAPAAMVDIATLTGGVITALGRGAAGVMGNDAGVVERLKRAGDASGEKVWELPLWDDEYKKAIRSDVADMKNSVGRAGSAIGGGMLLKQFVRKVPWAHLDIAGTAWAESDSPYRPKGATGFGVRLLAEYVAGYAED